MEPTKGAITVSIKSNNTVPETQSETNIKKKSKRKTPVTVKRSSSEDPTKGKTSNDKSIELEIIISTNSGSEHHKITETYDHRNLGVPTHLDMIKWVKPGLNLGMLQHIPTENAVTSI